jgi:hypothetical protein
MGKRYIMKILIFLLMPCCYATCSAFGRDSAEMRRERLIFCGQFVIEEPGPAIVPDSTHECCRFAHRIHNCHLMDWEENYS